MTIDQGQVITDAKCHICDRMIPINEVDVIHHVVAHTDCLPSHWVESRDLAVESWRRAA